MEKNGDSLREKLDFAMYCTKHPKTLLTFTTEGSRVGASSAYEVNIQLMVHPCRECEWEYMQFRDAVEIIMEHKSDKATG